MITYHSKDYPGFNENGYLYQLIKNRTLTAVEHNHDFFELVFIFNGNVRHNIDGISSSYGELQFTVLSPDMSHRFEKQSADLEAFSLSIAPSKFIRFLSAYEFEPIYGKIYSVKNKNFIKEIRLLPSQIPEKQKLTIHLIIASFFNEMIQDATSENETLPQNLRIAMEKIHLPQNLSGGVERLAELAGYSRIHLCRLVKKYFGETPSEIIHRIRMTSAAEYLQKTSYTIETIAENLGISSISQFHVAFKKYYKCTPNQYRKANSTYYPLFC